MITIGLTAEDRAAGRLLGGSLRTAVGRPPDRRAGPARGRGRPGAPRRAARADPRRHRRPPGPAGRAVQLERRQPPAEPATVPAVPVPRRPAQPVRHLGHLGGARPGRQERHVRRQHRAARRPAAAGALRRRAPVADRDPGGAAPARAAGGERAHRRRVARERGDRDLAGDATRARRGGRRRHQDHPGPARAAAGDLAAVPADVPPRQHPDPRHPALARRHAEPDATTRDP